jgi:transcriptional regulator with XRE-family HTH domain
LSQSLGHALRQARDVRGFSTMEAARSAGISSAYLSKLESDAVKKPSPDILHRLGQTLGLPYADLMVLAGYQVPGDPDAATPSRLNGALFSDLTDDEREELLEYLAWYRARRKPARNP